MKVLVTGGGGFLGSSICRQLLASGHLATAFQRSPAPHLTSLGVACEQGDVRDAETLRLAIDGHDAVIHCAAKAGIWGDAAPYHDINVSGTANVVEACRATGAGHLILTSSPSVVLNGHDIEGGDESLPLVERTLTPYQASKIEAERIVLDADSIALRTTVLRPDLMWGPGDPHVLPRLIARTRRKRLFLPAPEKNVDPVFVVNAARAHVQALEELAGIGRCAGKAYFVTNNNPLPQGEFVRRLLEAAGVPAHIRRIPPAVARFAGNAMERMWSLLRIETEPLLTRFTAAQFCVSHWFDGTAAQRDFGYVAPIGLQQGLEAVARQHRAPQ